MLDSRRIRLALAMILATCLVAPVGATTLIRQGLDDLVVKNDTVLIGEVVDAFSYWNEDGTFILTDIRIVATEVLKGRLEGDEVTVTLMGGTVGDLSTLILGGAVLEPGASYVLFLGDADLPGAPGARTVRDHMQGAFDLVQIGDELRAISQANGHPLMPDALGYTEAAGGEEGYPLEGMVETMREIVEIAAKKGAANVR